MKRLTPTPGADYDHPLEMLAACHDRIEERLDVLQRLIAHLAVHGCDGEARQAATNIMRYFDTAGAFHHDDEEVNLFPALAARMPSDERLRELVTRLCFEHDVMRALWKSLRASCVIAAVTSGLRGARAPSLDSDAPLTLHLREDEKERRA